MLRVLLTIALTICSGSLAAQDEPPPDPKADFVAANILGIFYHELGHALIDIEEVPIFAQEEDAADVFSIYLIDTLFDEESAEALAYDAAFGFWAEAENRNRFTDEIAWWDVHGPDEQRFYNTVCIFYGANPEARQDFAEDLGLPEERAEYCPFEYDQANAAWGGILDEIAERRVGARIVFSSEDDLLATELLREEVAFLNQEFTLSDALTVAVAPCGEANAFYDPNERAITFCSEFEDYLWELADRL